MSTPTIPTVNPKDEFKALFDALKAMSDDAHLEALDVMYKLQQLLTLHAGQLYLEADDLHWAVLKLRQIARKHGLIE